MFEISELDTTYFNGHREPQIGQDSGPIKKNLTRGPFLFCPITHSPLWFSVLPLGTAEGKKNHSSLGELITLGSPTHWEGHKRRVGSGCPYLDSSAVVELEEPGWVVIDINHLNSHFCVFVHWGLSTVCGSELQGVAGCLWQNAQ